MSDMDEVGAPEAISGQFKAIISYLKNKFPNK
jgi:hypothetical protein